MSARTNMLYELETANRALPLVRAIVRDVVTEFRVLAERGPQAAGASRLDGRKRRIAGDVYARSARGRRDLHAYRGLSARAGRPRRGAARPRDGLDRLPDAPERRARLLLLAPRRGDGRVVARGERGLRRSPAASRDRARHRLTWRYSYRRTISKNSCRVFGSRAEPAEHARRDRPGVLLGHAAHHHAEVLRLDRGPPRRAVGARRGSRRRSGWSVAPAPAGASRRRRRRARAC